MKVVSMAQRVTSGRLRQDIVSASDLFLDATNPSMSETDFDEEKQQKKARWPKSRIMNLRRYEKPNSVRGECVSTQ